MKKVLIIALLALSSVAVFARSATPCTDAWSACVDVSGYPNAGCDAGWDACMEALY